MKQLLPAQAAIYYDAIHRELQDDIPFLLSVLPEAGRVVELGSGTGRVLVPLATAGLTMTGIDNDEAMLARAAARPNPATITSIKQNFISLALPTLFDAALISHNTVMHVPDTQLNKLFQGIAAHLLPDGRLIIDTLNPLLMMALDSTEQWEEERTFTADNGDEVTQFSRYTVDEQQQIVHVAWRYDVGRDSFSAVTDYHYHLPHTLQMMMHQHGLIWEATYGDYDKTPYTDDSDLLLIVARKTA